MTWINKCWCRHCSVFYLLKLFAIVPSSTTNNARCFFLWPQMPTRCPLYGLRASTNSSRNHKKASLSPNELSQDRASGPIFFQIEVGFEQRPLVSQATYNIIFQSYAPLWNAHTLKSISSPFNPLANWGIVSHVHTWIAFVSHLYKSLLTVFQIKSLDVLSPKELFLILNFTTAISRPLPSL